MLLEGAVNSTPEGSIDRSPQRPNAHASVQITESLCFFFFTFRPTVCHVLPKCSSSVLTQSIAAPRTKLQVNGSKLLTVDPQPMGSGSAARFLVRRGSNTCGFSVVRQMTIEQCALCCARPLGLALWVHHINGPFSPTTVMKKLLKIRRKKSPQPPQNPISPENPVDVTAGKSGFQTGLSALSEGESSPYQDCRGCPDWTIGRDEGGGVASRMVPPDGMDEDQEHPASEPSTPAVMIGDADCRDEPTSECS